MTEFLTAGHPQSIREYIIRFMENGQLEENMKKEKQYLSCQNHLNQLSIFLAVSAFSWNLPYKTR